MSRSEFLVLAEREGIAITQRYGRRGVPPPRWTLSWSGVGSLLAGSTRSWLACPGPMLA
jgi:hypothetical protein